MERIQPQKVGSEMSDPHPRFIITTHFISTVALNHFAISMRGRQQHSLTPRQSGGWGGRRQPVHHRGLGGQLVGWLHRSMTDWSDILADITSHKCPRALWRTEENVSWHTTHPLVFGANDQHHWDGVSCVPGATENQGSAVRVWGGEVESRGHRLGKWLNHVSYQTHHQNM